MTPSRSPGSKSAPKTPPRKPDAEGPKLSAKLERELAQTQKLLSDQKLKVDRLQRDQIRAPYGQYGPGGDFAARGGGGERGGGGRKRSRSLERQNGRRP